MTQKQQKLDIWYKFFQQLQTVSALNLYFLTKMLSNHSKWIKKSLLKPMIFELTNFFILIGTNSGIKKFKFWINSSWCFIRHYCSSLRELFNKISYTWIGIFVHYYIWIFIWIVICAPLKLILILYPPT